MTTGKIHLISAIIDKFVETTCSMIGYYDEDGYLIREASCAKFDTTYQMVVTHEKKRVTCCNCIRKMDDNPKIYTVS